MVTRVDQTANGGVWRPVATALPFAAGADSFVIIANNTGEPDKIVMADAVRWSYAGSQDNPLGVSVPDWWANFYFGGNVNAALDPDGDGLSTYAEYILGTDPTDGNSRISFRAEPTVGGMNFIFSPWQGGRIYQLASATNLVSPSWTLLPNTPLVTGNVGTFTLTNPAATGGLFCRLAVHLAP